MSDIANKEEIVRCLKEANIYEENMSEDLMNNFYRAIKNSEVSLEEEMNRNEETAEKSLNESANELLEAINNSESIAPSNNTKVINKCEHTDDEDWFDEQNNVFVIKKNTEETFVTKENEKNNNSTDVLSDVTVNGDVIIDTTSIGFNDMPDSEKQYPLKVITHQLKNVNIQNSKKFLISSSEERVKMLYDYHIALSKLQAHYARLSRKMAPIKPPIRPSKIDPSKIFGTASAKEDDLQPQEAYVSRSGRITKRKVYIDNDDSNEETCFKPKKTKSDNEWISKSPPKGKTPKSQAKKVESTENDVTVEETVVEDKFDEVKPPVSRLRTYQKKLSNEEIMARSSLFNDTSTPKKSRGQALLMAGRAEADKLKEREEEMEKFANSLGVEPESADDDSEKIVVEDDEKEFQKRRVTPPRPAARKAIHSRQRVATSDITPLNITTKKPNVSESQENKGIPAKNTPAPKKANSIYIDELPSTSTTPRPSKQELNMVQCPLCTIYFHQRKIEEHAATCGEELVTHSYQKHSKISCDICDAVIPLTTNYEVHVRECIAKQNGI